MNPENQSLFFSVIIPLYNKEKYIEQTLNFEDFEIIVVNDGSTDNSISIIENFDDDRIKLIHQKNKGVSAARNTGIKEAKGDYIVLLDADDIWFENHLQNFVYSINEFPEEKVFCNNYQLQFSEKSFKDTQFSYLPSSNKIVLINNFFKSNLLDSIATSSTICIERELFQQRNFDTNLKAGEDSDYWIYLGLKYNFVLNTDVSAVYNKNIRQSLSKKNNINSLFCLIQKFLEQEKDNFFLKKFLDYNRFFLILDCKKNGDITRVKTLRSQIDYKNLNNKQLILLNLPNNFIKLLYHFKLFLDKSNFFLSVSN